MSDKAQVKQVLETAFPNLKVKEEKDGTFKVHMSSLKKWELETLVTLAQVWNFTDYTIKRSGLGITLVVKP